MPKVLSLTPTEGETPEAFAQRAAQSIKEFFGDEEAAPPGDETAEPAAEPAPETTDETVEPDEDEVTASLHALFADYTEFGRGPGWVTNPEGTRKLHAYWVKGEGAQKIRWGTDGDFARCEKLVGEKIAKNDPGKLRFIQNICAQWHKDATGATPGNAPGES